MEPSHPLLLFLFPSCSTPVGLDTQVDSRIPPKCSAGSPIIPHDRNRQREGGRPETTASNLPSCQGSPWAQAVPGHRAGGQGQEQREAPELGLGQGEPWWQLQDVDITPYLGLLALTPRPQPPLGSGAPAAPSPHRPLLGFRCLGRGREVVCLINHFRPPWETH